MSSVSTYLNFQGQTEEAFTLYSRAFAQPLGPIMRFRDMPADARPPLNDNELDMVMHAEMDIVAGHRIMATDMVASMGQNVRVGNNTTINLNLDTRDEADRMYAVLSEGGAEGSGMRNEFWGYWGSCLDRLGIRWMFNVAPAN